MTGFKKAILLNSTTSSNHLGCYLTSLGLRRLLIQANIDVVFECDVNQADLEFAKEVLDLDPDFLVVVNGEGTFHDDQPYAVRLIGFLDGLSNSKLLLNSQFKNMSKRYIEKLKSFDLVQVRTKTDHKYVLESGLFGAVYCPDMLFYSGVTNMSYDFASSGLVVMTDSHVKSETVSLFSAYLGIKEAAKWLNFHFYPAGSPSRPSQIKVILAKVIAATNIVSYAHKGYAVLNRTNASGLVREFASSRGVVTGRYHGACLAIALRKPFLYGRTNTSKIIDLCMDFGVGGALENCNDLHKFDWESVSTQFDSKLLQAPYDQLLKRLIGVVT